MDKTALHELIAARKSLAGALEANGEPVRRSNGRVKYASFQESTKVSDKETAKSMLKKKVRELNGLESATEPVKHTTIGELADLDEGWLRNRERAEGTIYCPSRQKKRSCCFRHAPATLSLRRL